MKLTKIFQITTFLTLTLCHFAQAIELEIDTAHSSIGFDIKHLVVSTVHGSFMNFDGIIDFNEQDLPKSSVNFTVKTDSISTANTKRDEHLKSADFLDVQKFPEAKFISTSIKKAGKDKYQLMGNLTLHGVTKPVIFTMHNLGKNKDPYGTEKYMFQASTEFSRKDFGLTYNKTLDTGGVLISDQVKLTADLEAMPKPMKADEHN
jgi:polyisoprenoid-binding protein YceI